MDKINAVITGVGGYVPEDVLTNEDISKMVDTTDEWIMTRVGIKERRILKGEGVGLSYMGIRAVKQLLEKTNLNPEEVEVILTATTTPDHHFPTTSSIIAYHTANYRGVRCLGYYFTDRRRRLSASDHEIGRLGLSSFSRDGGQP